MTSALWVSGASCLVTLWGGLIALRLQAYRGVVFAFCAGALVAVALIEVIPDALELLKSSGAVHQQNLLIACALGFLFFYLLEQATHGTQAREDPSHHTHPHQAGFLGALGIGVHSFLDGFAIGQAFQAGGEMGAVIGAGVLLHKLADGVSSVGIMLGTQHTVRATTAMLLVTACAPIAGVLTQSFISVSTPIFSLMLGWFAGVFLYLGASSLLPTAHEASRSRWLPFATLAGAALVYCGHRLSQ